MQLKRLEAYGFKSFADRIRIDFDKGITAVVGPNGSGKSNITDAIRWVLGEQNIRNLRGLKSEDLIFAGSPARKALGVAEVSLTFDNADGGLPVDFREVCVTRRLYRSGDSEFFINGSHCRLKDVYNLFADTGIGHDGMSIISQNRMDEILNARPEERRAFFEETAGITKYRNRKRESMRKLLDTENNLVRVHDILHEIETQLEPMAKHAEKTRQYNAMHDEYQSCLLTRFAHDYAREAKNKEANDAKLTQARDAATAAETKAQTLAAQGEQIQKNVLELEQKMQQQAASNETIRQKIATAASEMARLKERQEQSQNRQAHLQAGKQGLQANLVQAIATIAQLAEQAANKQAEKKNMQASLAKLQNEEQALKQQLFHQEGESHKAAKERQDKMAALVDVQQQLAVATNAVENYSTDAAERQQTLEQAKAKETELAQKQQQLAEQVQAQETLVKQRIAEQQEAQHQRVAAQQQQTKLRVARQQCSDSLHEAQARRQILLAMQKEYEGFGRSVKAVLTQKAAWRQGIAGAVAEIIAVPKDYVTAIEVALGSHMQNVVTEDTDTARKAIAYLKKSHRGRVTFLPLSTITIYEPQRDLPDAPGVVGWANDLVDVEERYQKIADFLLARTLVVDTLDHALALAKQQNYRQRIVTLEGELLAPGGSLAGGSARSREVSFLSRESEIQQLEREIAAAQEKLEHLTTEREAAQKAVNAAEQTQIAALNQLQEANVRRAELKAQQTALQQQLESQQQSVQALAAAIARQQQEYQEKQQQQKDLSAKQQELQAELGKADASQQEQQEKLADLQQQADQLSEKLQQQKLSQAVLEQEALRSQERLAEARKQKAQSEQSLAANEQEDKQLAADLSSSQERLKQLQQQDEDWQLKFMEGRENHDALAKDRLQALSNRADLDKKAQAANRAQKQAQEDVHKLELVETRLSVALDDFKQRIFQEFGLTPERAAAKAMDVEPAKLRQRMQKLEKAMQDLGPVNPNALAEYEALQKRHGFMQKQAQDLETAEKDLQSILKEMDAAMTKQFQEAFAQIQEYFADTFVRLFGGGKAELKLLDEANVLESGIDILVTLPKKKRQNLSALSGGERALTVIALLFAFLRYKPSPFAVLDEIDAPLDEANIVRFRDFLREFVQKTQFIVVTHRKGTMEAADTMYGVTIVDAGVTRLLSVKLDDAPEMS